MKFGSWTYDGTKINLTAMNEEIDISTYQPSGEWDLIGRYRVHLPRSTTIILSMDVSVLNMYSTMDNT